MNKKGFTLIELLVVIAIIGLLSTIAVVSFSDARAKARDAKRLSDVRQLAGLIELENTEAAATALETCTTADSLTYTCTGPNQISQFTSFKDPSTPGTACVAASTGTCGYAVSKADGTAGAPTTADYQICFYLEKASGSLAAGLHRIITGSVLDGFAGGTSIALGTAGCN